MIAGRLVDFSAILFTFWEDGHLLWDGIAAEIPSLPWQRIRVVGLRGKEWHLDPMVEAEQVQSLTVVMGGQYPCRAGLEPRRVEVADDRGFVGPSLFLRV